MLETIIICKKLGVLARYYKELIELSEHLTLDQYTRQLVMKRAVEREIQLLVECATDINNMILKRLNQSPGKDYFNSFIDLAENGVIDMDFALKIAPSTGLRNILVHEYQKIDDAIVYKSIANIVDYYKEYISRISSYLECDQVNL